MESVKNGTGTKRPIAFAGAPVMLPKFTTTEINALASPQEGWEVFDTTIHKKKFYNGTAWETITSA